MFSALVPGKSMDKIAMAGIDVCRARGVFPGCIILGGEFAGGLMPFQPVAPRVLRLPSPAMFHNRHGAASVANRSRNLFRKSTV